MIEVPVYRWELPEDLAGPFVCSDHRGDFEHGTGHGFDLGGDFRHEGDVERAGIACRGGGIEPVDIGEEDEEIGVVSTRDDATLAVAIAAIPSPRPRKPSLSLVVALTETRWAATPRMREIASTMAARCGPIRRSRCSAEC